MQVSIHVGADGASAETLHELVAWAERHSPVGEPLTRVMPTAYTVEIVQGFPAGAACAADVAVLLAHLPQAPADPHAVAAAIHTATGGNAFFVLETVRALLEAGRLADPPERLPLAGTVQAAIQRRLGRLSPLGRQVLETAAVLAPDLALDLLAQTAGRSSLEAAQGLDELARRQLLEGGEMQRFSHDLVRQAVYDQISPWRRRILHHQQFQM